MGNVALYSHILIHVQKWDKYGSSRKLLCSVQHLSHIHIARELYSKAFVLHLLESSSHSHGWVVNGYISPDARYPVVRLCAWRYGTTHPESTTQWTFWGDAQHRILCERKPSQRGWGGLPKPKMAGKFYHWFSIIFTSFALAKSLFLLVPVDIFCSSCLTQVHTQGECHSGKHCRICVKFGRVFLGWKKLLFSSTNSK